VKHIDIEQVGTGGTSLGKFTRTRPVAVAEEITDHLGRTDRWDLRSLTSREIIGQLTCTGFQDVYTAWNVDDVRGESSLAKSNATFMEGITAILGAPGYGYTHYRKVT
jgi:hypothetical protein